MTKLHQVYECQVCGNRVEVIRPGAGTLVCCNQPMNLYEENTVDALRKSMYRSLLRLRTGTGCK